MRQPAAAAGGARWQYSKPRRQSGPCSAASRPHQLERAREPDQPDAREADRTRRQNRLICTQLRSLATAAGAAHGRRYGARPHRGRMVPGLRIVGVARLRRASYVAASFVAGACGQPSRSRLCSWRCPMTAPAATASTSLVPVQSAFTDAERLALAGFLAGYRGLTREACTLDLRQFISWCRTGPCRCSPSAAPTSRPSPANWKRAGVPAPRSPGGCAPSPGSANTPSAHLHRTGALSADRRRVPSRLTCICPHPNGTLWFTRVGLAGCRVGSCGSWSEPSVKVVDDRSVARVSSAGIPVGALLGGSAAEDQPGQTPYRSDGERRSGRLWTMLAVHARSLRLQELAVSLAGSTACPGGPRWAASDPHGSP